MLSVTLVLAVFMGVIVGMLGAGGSILTVPLLVYLVELEPKVAIASSLLVVGLTSAGGVVHHGWQGNVHWRTGFVFGAFSMIGAFLAGSVAEFVSGELLLLLFAGVMAVSAIGLLRYHPVPVPEHMPARPVTAGYRMAALGLGVGTLTGLVGAGGGFLIVPALVMLAKLDMRSAVGTSLLVIVLNAFAGFAGYMHHEPIEWALALEISAAAIVGALGGAALSSLVSQTSLRHAFAWLVLVMAVVIASHQLLPYFAMHAPHAERTLVPQAVGAREPVTGEARQQAEGHAKAARTQPRGLDAMGA